MVIGAPAGQRPSQVQPALVAFSLPQAHIQQDPTSVRGVFSGPQNLLLGPTGPGGQVDRLHEQREKFYLGLGAGLDGRAPGPQPPRISLTVLSDTLPSPDSAPSASMSRTERLRGPQDLGRWRR